jgi:hypothetical protein
MVAATTTEMMAEEHNLEEVKILMIMKNIMKETL